MPPDLLHYRSFATSLVNFSPPDSPLLFFILSTITIFRLVRIATTTSSSKTPLPSAFPPSLHDSGLTRKISGNSTALKKKEFKLLSDLIKHKAPCNLLIFGLEAQYLKLSSINSRGLNVFLENDPHKISTIRAKSNHTRIYKFDYDVPREVYKKKWDVVVVDGPSGHSPEAPGRMAAIYTASMLARRGKNTTNVLVHDVNRTIEKWFSWEFLCDENLVSSKGKLWNFGIRGRSNSTRFCTDKVFQE